MASVRGSFCKLTSLFLPEVGRELGNLSLLLYYTRVYIGAI